MQAMLQTLYERFDARDVDAILPSLAPDVAQRMGGRVPARI